MSILCAIMGGCIFLLFNIGMKLFDINQTLKRILSELEYLNEPENSNEN